MPSSRPPARPSTDRSRPGSFDRPRQAAGQSNSSSQPSSSRPANVSGQANPSGQSNRTGGTGNGGAAGNGGGAAATRRGRNASRANAKRAEQSRAFANGEGAAPVRRPNAQAQKVDLFAAFETGPTPNLDASFAELGVPAALVKALHNAGIEKPFPIQAATMADCLAGRDVLGRGRTGSGKTLAFVLPLLTRLAANPWPGSPGVHER